MKKRETNILKSISTALCFLLVAGLFACGENRVADNEVMEEEVETEGVATAETWDSNEFNTRFTSTNNFKDWDRNSDTFLDEDEYTRGFYSTWDVNDDNRLDENEWKTASNDWGLQNENWADWDTSGDGSLDENEFRTRFANTGWNKQWDLDRDNRLNEREYSDGVFGLWDRNRDNMLDENEYRGYNTYYGD